MLLTQQPGVRFSAFPRIRLLMLLRFFDGTAYNSGQRLENVNRTHLLPASGKLVLKKIIAGIVGSINARTIYLPISFPIDESALSFFMAISNVAKTIHLLIC